MSIHTLLSTIKLLNDNSSDMLLPYTTSPSTNENVCPFPAGGDSVFHGQCVQLWVMFSPFLVQSQSYLDIQSLGD